MMRKLSTWFIFAVAATALMAGCGGKSNSTSSTSATTNSPTTTGGSSTPTSSAHAPTGTGGTGPSGATSATPAQQRAFGKHSVASCKSAIQAQTSIPASAKAKLEGICGKAASGSQEAIQAVAHEECIALVNATPLPNSVSKQRALALCKAPG